MKPTFIVITFLLYFPSGQAQNVPSSTGSQVTQQDAQAALDFHNKVRADVGSPPIQWSAELAAYAQEWANHLIAKCKLDHRPNSGPWAQKYGENIFWGGGEEYTVLHACESWYSEIEKYQYGPLGASWFKTGHYTQMVWKSTTHLGMAKVVCKDGAILIVANYRPSGNFMGEKPY
jgi:pathogenesis-related protein 1